jgi:hypothetical protein
MYCRFLCNILTTSGIFRQRVICLKRQAIMDMENKKEEAMLMVCPLRLYVYINSLSILCAPLYLNFDKSLHLHLNRSPLIFAFNRTHTPTFTRHFFIYTILTCKYFVNAVQSTGCLLRQTNLESTSHRENGVPNMPSHRLLN